MRNINSELAKLSQPIQYKKPTFTFDVGHVGVLANLGGGFDDTDLKAYWKCNEVSGDIINQSQSAVDLGSGADGQVTGATYVSSGGGSPFDYELSFDGVNDKLVFGSSTSQFNFMHNTVAKWTLNFWLKKNTLATAYQLFSTFLDTGVDTGVSIYTNANDNLEIVIWNGVTVIPLIFASTANFFPNTNWHMYTIQYDQSLGSNNLTVKRDNANTENATKSAGTPSSGNHDEAGRFGERSNGTKNLDGDLAEMSLWSDILTTRLSELYNSGSGLEIY